MDHAQSEVGYVIIAFAIMVLVLGAWITHSLHHSWRLFARFSRDWERQADMHEASQARHEAACKTVEDSLVRAQLALFARHDRVNGELCRKQVAHWAEKIPARYRDAYLLEAACEHG